MYNATEYLHAVVSKEHRQFGQISTICFWKVMWDYVALAVTGDSVTAEIEHCKPCSISGQNEQGGTDMLTWLAPDLIYETVNCCVHVTLVGINNFGHVEAQAFGL